MKKLLVMLSLVVFAVILSTFTVCSAEDYAFYYEIVDEEVIITNGHSYEEIVIPETIEGYPVTTIADNAWEWANPIDSITIPSTIKHIGEAAFRDVEVKNVRITDIAAWCQIEFESKEANPLNSAGQER